MTPLRPTLRAKRNELVLSGRVCDIDRGAQLRSVLRPTGEKEDLVLTPDNGVAWTVYRRTHTGASECAACLVV